MVGLEGPEYEKYKVGPVCSVPGCVRLSDHAHHVVRRSFLAGDYAWVRMPDKIEIGNLVGLCWRHHKDITENQEQITYDKGKFFWTDGVPLKTQPPKHTVGDDILLPNIPVLAESELGIGHVLVEGHDPEICPTCKRRIPRPKIDTQMEEKKPRATWGIAIPVDARENGYQVLDELLEAAREKLDAAGISYGTSSKVRYHILTATLGIFVSNAEVILSDG